jgi:allantoin racemase
VIKIGLLIPTSGYTPEELDRRVALAAARVPADVEFVVAVPPDAPEFLDQGKDFGRAISAAGDFVRGVADSGVDVIIASGAIDPGLAQVRAAVQIPVIGPGEASLYAASVVGRPISLVTVDEHAVVTAKRCLDNVVAKPEVVSIRSIEVPVREVMKDFERAREALRRECKMAVAEDGAEGIFLGCMVFGTLDIADELRSSLGVPVFDPFAISIDTAYQVAQQLPRQ